MSGGDDFRTQYKDWGFGEPDPPAGSTPTPLMVLRDLVRQHTPKLVRMWLDSAIEEVEKEKKAQRDRERREEIKRLKRVAEDGDQAKARIRELEREE